MKRKYTKRSEYWNKNVSKAASPAAPVDTQEARLVISKEIGTLGLNSIQLFTNFLQNYELRFPECIRTYKEMGYDPDVATALDATYTFVDRAFFDFTINYNTKSAKSKKAAKFVDYSLRNMEAPLRQYIRSLLSYKQFGFALAEKVYQQDTNPSSPYYGYYRLQKLAARPQDTLDITNPFVFSDDGREILSINQNIVKSLNSRFFSPQSSGVKNIPMSKIILVGNNITEGNPLGESPLAAVYRSWREKSLIQEYEVVGVSKDLGGMPVLKVPSTILNRAALDPGGEEAQSLLILQQNIANLHAGEQQYMVMPSDLYENTSMQQYELTFQGVEGNGKQFDTNALIKQRQLDIFNRFGAGVLIMGNEGGSYSLSDNKQTLLSHYIERDVNIIIEMINTQIIPQLLRINGFSLDDADIPKFASQDIGDPDVDTNSSAIQRVVAAGAIPLTPEIFNEFFEMLNMKYRLPEDVVSDPVKFKEFCDTYLPKSTTRSGDGMAQGTSGNGTSTSVSSVDTSVSNLAN